METKDETSSTAEPAPSFYNYPSPREGPHVPYSNDASANPVLRGLPLAIVTTMYALCFGR